MRTSIFSTLLLLASFAAYSANRFWVASTLGAWNNSANWSTTSGGTGGASVPGSGDVAILNASSSFGCVLTTTVTVGGITMSGYTGQLNLGGLVLNVTGTSTFASGQVVSGTISFNSTSVTFSGTQFFVPITGSSGQIFFNGGSFNTSVNLTKTGATSETGSGGTQFNSTFSLTNAGTGTIAMSGSSTDDFNGDATFTLQNGNITLGAGGLTRFNGNLIFNSSSSGTISTSLSLGASLLATGRTLSVGTGFSSGTLELRRFEGRTGSSVNLTLTGTANLTFIASYFEGSVTASAPSIDVTYGTFSGTTSLQKTGNANQSWTGGATFNGATTITNSGAGTLTLDANNLNNYFAATTFNNSGSGSFIFASQANTNFSFGASLTLNSNLNSGSSTNSFTAGDKDNSVIFISGKLTLNIGGSVQSNVTFLSGVGANAFYSGDVEVNLTNTNANTKITLGANSGSSNYSGDITLGNSSTTTSTTGGVFFNEGTGSSTLASGKTVKLNTVNGFQSGTISLRRFRQDTGSTQAISLSLASTATRLVAGPLSTFRGAFSGYAADLEVASSSFQGDAYFEKTGGGTSTLTGANLFNGNVTFSNASSGGTLIVAGSGGDTYNGNVTFTRSGSAGNIVPAFSGTNTFSGNISIPSGSVLVTMGANTGTVVMAGNGGVQTITSSVSLAITRLTMNTTNGGSVATSSSIDITGNLQFNSGRIVTTSIIGFANGATATGASSSSFVDGIVAKSGTQAFTFPVGAGTSYRPISISAPAANTVFGARFFRGTQTFGGESTYSSPVQAVNGCEYWTLDRFVGSSSVNVTLSWNSSECASPYITDPSKLLVSRWNGTNWVSEGNGGTTGNVSAGTIVSGAAVTSFSPFALGTSSPVNPLPITLLYFKAESEEEGTLLTWKTASEINNAEFQIERSVDGRHFDVVGRVPGSGSSRSPISYSFVDHHPLPGTSYYRLKQVDYDGTSTSFDIVRVNNSARQVNFFAYPNPANDGALVRTNYAGPVELIDQYGLTAARFEDGTQINTAQIPTGIYVLRNGEGQTYRLIVVNPM